MTDWEGSDSCLLLASVVTGIAGNSHARRRPARFILRAMPAGHAIRPIGGAPLERGGAQGGGGRSWAGVRRSSVEEVGQDW